MTDREIMKLVEVRLKELDLIQEDLRALKDGNVEVFERYEEFIEMYNNCWDAVKNLLKGLESPDAVRIGAFSRDRRNTTIKYKPSLLPNDVLTIPGVVKDVNEKKISELLAQGIVEQHQLEQAQYNYERSPSVRSDLKKAENPTLSRVGSQR